MDGGQKATVGGAGDGLEALEAKRLEWLAAELRDGLTMEERRRLAALLLDGLADD